MIGDPTEAALVVLAAKLGVSAEETRRAYPRLAEVPFDSAYKFMMGIGTVFNALTNRRTTRSPEFAELAQEELEERAKDALARGIAELSEVQELLWATTRYALLVVLQAMDAAGKDSVIKYVMSGVNPQGVQVVSFRKPSAEELDHTFLWRVSKALPERGRIGIFNRSHYEEVVPLKVHPEWLEPQRLPPGDRGDAFWQERYEDINAFERHLDRNGRRSSSSSCTSPRTCRRSDSSRVSISPARSGSSTRPTSRSGPASTITVPRSRMR